MTFLAKTFFKRKNGKKESANEAAAIPAKGNGINTWITEAEYHEEVCAGDEDEKMHYCFMP